ncbi:hypothetical protein [Deinococcus humi]|uniref:META domain-containing protein n=1 Tax=Deinococcus humi TaxID=662880 RepID=A0A7W8JXU2_9DEIO|nr:hypothetical protein [Deinococcus humi]MBB5363639.1 hypothetical protein [Deinococcus humi]GGO29949.1 hypothetical protein GCM10008949_24140 [Deinococcus humi]
MYRLMTCFALLCSAALAAPSSAPTGEWLTGPAFPAPVYEEDFAGAAASGTRLLLLPDGHYSRTELNFSYIPGFFGSYVITCGTLNVHAERGRYAVSGDRLTFQPEQVREVHGLSPSALNSGCKRSEGIASTPKLTSYQATFALSGTQLAVNIQGTRQTYAPRPARAADEVAAASRSVPVGGLTARNASVTPPTTPLITSEPYTATGTWQAKLDVSGMQVPLQFKLYDDGEQSLSGSGYVGSQYVAWVLGSRTGAFDLGLDVDGTELKLKVEGRFTGDRYEGTFRAQDGSGADLGGGTLNMSRDAR